MIMVLSLVIDKIIIYKIHPHSFERDLSQRKGLFGGLHRSL